MAREEKAEKLRKRVHDAFVLFEYKEGSRLLDVKEVPTVLRSLGYNPNGTQIAQVLDGLTTLNENSDTPNLIPMEMFEKLATKFLIDNEAALFRDDYHTLLRAYRAFDTEGRGWIEADVVRQHLGSRGEPMSEDELNRMINFQADEQGRIFYEDACQKLATDGMRV